MRYYDVNDGAILLTDMISKFAALRSIFGGPAGYMALQRKRGSLRYSRPDATDEEVVRAAGRP